MKRKLSASGICDDSDFVTNFICVLFPFGVHRPVVLILYLVHQRCEQLVGAGSCSGDLMRRSGFGEDVSYRHVYLIAEGIAR